MARFAMPGGSRTVSAARVYPGPAPEVFSRVLLVLKQLGYSVAKSNPASGSIKAYTGFWNSFPFSYGETLLLTVRQVGSGATEVDLRASSLPTNGTAWGRAQGHVDRILAALGPGADLPSPTGARGPDYSGVPF